jgi:hypothetical protein
VQQVLENYVAAGARLGKLVVSCKQQMGGGAHKGRERYGVSSQSQGRRFYGVAEGKVFAVDE